MLRYASQRSRRGRLQLVRPGYTFNIMAGTKIKDRRSLMLASLSQSDLIETDSLFNQINKSRWYHLPFLLLSLSCFFYPYLQGLLGTVLQLIRFVANEGDNATNAAGKIYREIKN